MTDIARMVVEDLFVHPVKACAPLRVEALAFDEDGAVEGDREWAVVDERWGVTWQGAHPRLALVHPRWLRPGALMLQTAAGEGVAITPDEALAPCRVVIWNDLAKREDAFDAWDGGDAAAAFLRGVTGAPLRLVKLGREAMRREGASRVHLVHRGAFGEFVAALGAGGQGLADLARFRPNIVLADVTGVGDGGDDGASAVPFIEEQVTRFEWREGSAGSAPSSLVVGERCVRCIVPNVDPATGLVDERVLDVIATLSAQRFPGAPVCFGLYAAATGRATLRRGEVLASTLAF